MISIDRSWLFAKGIGIGLPVLGQFTDVQNSGFVMLPVVGASF